MRCEWFFSFAIEYKTSSTELNAYTYRQKIWTHKKDVLFFLILHFIVNKQTTRISFSNELTSYKQEWSYERICIIFGKLNAVIMLIWRMKSEKLQSSRELDLFRACFYSYGWLAFKVRKEKLFRVLCSLFFVFTV